MARDSRQQQLRDAKEFAAKHPDVHSVYLGFRHKGGKRTPERCIVFVVAKKLKKSELTPDRLIPSDFEGSRTDVVEVPAYTAESFTTDQRPCPGGYSAGHVNISAGTHGAPCFRGNDGLRKSLSNNHVYAASNDATVGDTILQRGDADGGAVPFQSWATLEAFATINFDGGGGGGGLPPIPDCPIATMFEQAVNWAIRNLTNSRSRIEAFNIDQRARQIVARQAVDQPSPNLIDAAVAVPVDGGMTDDIHIIGPVNGVTDARLGTRVQKTGRTTEHTRGRVVGIDGQVQVNYGGGRVATFDDQLIIEADSGDFSAGGDSGSAIMTMDGYIVGLLYAGGGGQTIANKISHVQAILGVRF